MEESEFFRDRVIGWDTNGCEFKFAGRGPRREVDRPDRIDPSFVSVAICIGIGLRCRFVSVLSSSPLNASSSLRPSASTVSISACSSFTDWVCSPFRSNSPEERCFLSRTGVCGADLKVRIEYEDGGGLRDDLREVGVPPCWYSLVRRADISEPNELSLASLRKCRGKVRLCTGDDVEGSTMESKDVGGGCDPGVELNRRLAALRNSPEKVETIDALE